MFKPSPEEASGPNLVIIYQLPSDIEEKLSQDELQCFYSWSEAQQRLFLKQAGVIPSISGTAATANKLARFGINRQEAKKDRTDALQGLILEALGINLKATVDDVLKALRKHERRGVIESIIDDVIEWTDKDGSAQVTQISALRYRVARARKKLQVR
jgi:hypothetical protein